jgi:hypothetical protein
MVAIVLGGAVLTIALGERIAVNGGQGWDGMSYTTWAGAFWDRVIVAGLSRYHSQRVLPSALVHYGLRLAGVTPDVRQTIAGFQVLDTVALGIAALCWAHLGEVMGWRRPARWVGFVALFGGFANARHALYYPTLTDPTAFLLGMVMVWGYLARRAWAVWTTAALGIVTWPALPPLAIAFLVLPRADPALAIAPASRRVRWVAVAGAAIGALGFLLVAWHYLVHPVPNVGDEKFALWVRRDLLPLTASSLFVVLAAGGYALLASVSPVSLIAYGRQQSWRRAAAAGASVAVLLIARAAWLARVGTKGEGPSGAQFLCEHTLAAIRGPLWGLVHHVVYFGPIVLVAAMRWRRIAAVAAAWGPAATLGLAMTLAFAAGSNSRQWNHLLPLLVAATIAASHERWTARRAAVFVVIALPWSKLWLRIGYDKHHNWQLFPDQWYFMNHGPYATDWMYLVHLVAAAVTAGALALVLRRPRR